MLEQKGMTRADLADIMGGKSRVSEFFAAKRDLSINQIRALRDVLGIPQTCWSARATTRASGPFATATGNWLPAVVEVTRAVKLSEFLIPTAKRGLRGKPDRKSSGMKTQNAGGFSRAIRVRP
jgi:transcriptional regulator with XRE-family HTH domain